MLLLSIVTLVAARFAFLALHRSLVEVRTRNNIIGDPRCSNPSKSLHPETTIGDAKLPDDEKQDKKRSRHHHRCKSHSYQVGHVFFFFFSLSDSFRRSDMYLN